MHRKENINFRPDVIGMLTALVAAYDERRNVLQNTMASQEYGMVIYDLEKIIQKARNPKNFLPIPLQE